MEGRSTSRGLREDVWGRTVLPGAGDPRPDVLVAAPPASNPRLLRLLPPGTLSSLHQDVLSTRPGGGRLLLRVGQRMRGK